MNSRRFLAVLSVIVLVPLLSQALPVEALQFVDVPDNVWFYSYVQDAVNAGIVSGYKDSYGNLTGRFGPGNPVTVGELLKIGLEGAGYDTSRGIGYGHWAAPYMSVALGLNFRLTRQQQLNLDRPATRAEVASVIADAFLLNADTFTGDDYSDVNAGTPYAGAIEALTNDDILSGDRDTQGNLTGRFRPNAAVNRAETVKIIIEARARYGEPGQYSSSAWWSSSRRFSSSSSRSVGQCYLNECGPAPAQPNWQCPDGTIGGPSCERLPDGRCGWLIRQCSYYSSRSSLSSSRSSSFSSSYQAHTFNVVYTGTGGFTPSFITIKVGDTIIFRNQSGDAQMWVASNQHPSHNEYPEFDQHGSVGTNGSYSFTFGRTGVWGYHNHLNSTKQGAVSVDPY